jgi:hypothetical protein
LGVDFPRWMRLDTAITHCATYWCVEAQNFSITQQRQAIYDTPAYQAQLAANGDGIVRPVLFTARDGATLSGHVSATIAGPARRPGIVITNGSVQADEQMYWYAAQTLAKAGYVVLTFDPQGQGQSDTFGQSPDEDEGVPAQTDGRPFYDGTEDAIDVADRAGGPLLRRGRGLLHRPVGPTGQGGGGARQPRRPAQRAVAR